MGPGGSVSVLLLRYCNRPPFRVAFLLVSLLISLCRIYIKKTDGGGIHRFFVRARPTPKEIKEGKYHRIYQEFSS